MDGQSRLHDSENDCSSDSDDGQEPAAKKARLSPASEALLRAPLERGWRRETLIKGLSSSGRRIRGEVTYISPCNRRFKQYPELVKVGFTSRYSNVPSIHKPLRTQRTLGRSPHTV